MIAPFLQAIPVLEKIESAGFEAYFVGGSVRDFLLKRDITDVDIATSATPEEIKAIFSKTIDVGIQHGTVMVVFQGETYEVTTFRSESEYVDFRRPDEVTFIRSLKEDLRRRDFTMNAIAMDKKGELVDPFSGQASIAAKEIKTVGEPKERFHEDALRMMRAIRFVSQLSFSLHRDTFHALKEHGKLLEHISVERLTIEFEKLLLGPDYNRATGLLIETGIYHYLPGFGGRAEQLKSFLQLQLDRNFSIEECWVLLLFHFELTPRDVEGFFRRWKQPLKKMRRVKDGLGWLYSRLEQDWTTEQLYKANKELVISTEKLYNNLKGQSVEENVVKLSESWDSLPIKERRELAATGQDLLEWFQIKGGPWIEEKLAGIEKAVLNGEIENDNEGIREWLLECNRP